MQDNKLKVGQIWKYKTRPEEEYSTLTILKVEKNEKDGIIVHIYVDGLKLKNPHIFNGISEDIKHLPLSENAVLMCITTLISENNKLPDFEDGYNSWKTAFDNNKGGIFNIEVGEVVKYVEQTLNSK